MLGLVLGLALLALPLATNRVHALANCSAGDVSLDAEEQAFLALINQYRTSHGLGVLTISPDLQRSATWMAVDMGAKNYFGHTDSLGRSPWTRMADCGVAAAGGENLAGGTSKSTGADAFEMFRNSPPHNDNMLFPGFREIGIARAYTPGSRLGWYWATDFGNGSPAAAPTATPTPPTPRPVPQVNVGGARAAEVPATTTPAPLDPPAKAGRAVALPIGLGLIQWPGADISAADFVARAGEQVTWLLGFDHSCGCYAIYSPMLPEWLNSLGKVQQGQSYWAAVDSPTAIALDQ
jgi:uncharacterized protein YkwD